MLERLDVTELAGIVRGIHRRVKTNRGPLRTEANLVAVGECRPTNRLAVQPRAVEASHVVEDEAPSLATNLGMMSGDRGVFERIECDVIGIATTDENRRSFKAFGDAVATAADVR